MKALSIRSPWWWYILHGGKDIENREWSTKYRGPVLVHASKWHGLQEIDGDNDFAARIARTAGYDLAPPTLAALHAARGCIVGRATIVDCVSRSASPWFFGRRGFALADPVAFARPIPFTGARRWFEVPDDTIITALAA